ncbi:hypothetical protein SAMN05444339_1231 [Loktanella atrilutea]|uniref:Uncharacterized protein n=1 Tax=Loktanella atrilutea TaxID=366533 RepID=A0A1M5FN69_LOKAT|nr:hypothetical protein SAMN05444339_1231 [Loktanella atrilutea]
MSIGRARRAIPEILDDQANGLSAMSREIIGDAFWLANSVSRQTFLETRSR